MSALEHRIWFLTGRSKVAKDKPVASEDRDWIAWANAGDAGIEYREAVYVDACEGIRHGLLPVVPEALTVYIRQLRKRAS